MISFEFYQFVKCGKGLFWSSWWERRNYIRQMRLNMKREVGQIS